jgi:hypothetical protein|tara:strand:+ start:276 stop:809 length:534 start_codon:yes stop_codon:yes gene_type:complete
MSEIEVKNKPGLPARLTPMQRKFAEILVFSEGHKFAYECAKEAGYEGDNATLRVKASQLQDPKHYPLVVKHIGELREENYKKHNISFGGHLTELAKIRDEAIKSKSFSAATNAEKARGTVGGLYIEQKIIRTGKIEDLSEEELNKRIATIREDHALLMEKTEAKKDPKDKKPKPILS